MLRNVAAHLELDIAGRTSMVLSLAVAQGAALASERLDISLDGVTLTPGELVDRHGSRLHQLISDKGRMTIDYAAEVTGQSLPASADDLDTIIYLRPSRYCESDTLLPTASSEFRGLSGLELLTAVSSWVHDRLYYVPGSSRVTDGAVGTLLARQGVCRDYAHLVIALLRAIDVPARMAAVYAPGLSPMDFHAVAEAFIDGQWHVVDATGLAPRQSLLRISTGRDAADIAFLTNHWANLTLLDLQVLAIVDELPSDDFQQQVQLR
ncbi:transglutaminase family protein [Glaciihabitans sp. INWT7]|uniref:transglutaminase-like domain-containing protein n=1 Tax=Glaciihabitans sp. INWT7 TaxID=2596912 RepID=UPI0016267352|nr:transglutaminase family protein [Glaciihabitans sp. INWT7]QNE46406.1 transglutaminase family protein [Glaciihabitans sp. INWT7]